MSFARGRLTTYGATKFAEHFSGQSSYTMPASLRMGLFSTEPGADVSGTELSGDGYARLPLTFDTPAANGDYIETSNASQEDFPEAEAQWTGFKWWVIFEHTTNNGLWWGHFGDNDDPDAVSTITVEAGQTFRIREGDVTLVFGPVVAPS